MGLDALDLTFRLEKQLGIQIGQAEGIAVLFGTAGNIHRYLVCKLQGEHREVPRIGPLFEEVVDAVNRIRGKRRMGSSYDLNKLFPAPQREANWISLERALGIPLPKLEQPANEAFPAIPRECTTVASLTYWVAENHPERAEWFLIGCERHGKLATRQWTDEEVRAILRECICGALGVKPEEVTYEARMIEDLGMS